MQKKISDILLVILKKIKFKVVTKNKWNSENRTNSTQYIFCYINGNYVNRISLQNIRKEKM